MGGPGSGGRPNHARRRAAAELRAQGLSYAEIGRRLGVTGDAARSLLGRATGPRRLAHPDLCCACCRRAIPGSAAAGSARGPVCCAGCLGELPEASFA
jgi:hypothetical protein